MDPLSEVLSLIRPVSSAFRGLDAGGDWSLVYPPFGGVCCVAIRDGDCLLCREGSADPIELVAGDLALWPSREPLRLCSRPDIEPVSIMDFMAKVPMGAVAVWGSGDDCSGVGGYFGFEGSHAQFVLSMLPPVLHVRAEATASLRLSIERLMSELRVPQPGGALVAEHLAQTLLIEALRCHLNAGAPGRSGWLFALSDPQLCEALGLLHAEPGRDWTLRELARRVGMSRSSFAARFASLVGETPMAYLTRWRMMVGAERIRKGEPVGQVATAMGYASNSAFSVAFKRTLGISPSDARPSSRADSSR